MEKTSKYRAAFFRRALSMLLALALTLGDLSMGVRATMGETEPSIPETTEAAAQAPTEAPTQAATEAPTEEPTQATTEAPTEAPTQAATEAPTEEPTQAATEESTEEQAEEAAAETGEETISNGIMPLSEGSTAIPFGGYRTYPLDIYNHQYYSSANAEVTLGSGSYEISGENVPTDTERGQPIAVGNHPKDGDDKTAPLDKDIPVFLKGLTMSEPMTIKPVGTENKQKAVLTVTEASKLETLIVEEKAHLELILEQALEVGSITLAEGTSLTVSGSGTLTVTGAFTSQGAVALNGGTIQAGSGISAGSLSLSGTTVHANGQSVTATEALSMADSTVTDAALFGYSEGSGTLTLSGRNTFSNVAAVGCPAGSAGRVSVEGIESVASSSGTIYYRDYTITYRSNGTDIAPKEGWPVAYRVSTGNPSFSGAAIQGYHTASGYTEAAAIPLPTDSLQPGYHHLGWRMGESEEKNTEITAPAGEILLTAVLEAGEVTVRLDRGYDPDRYSNDPVDGKLPERSTAIVSKLNETVTLPVPDRFGYKFTGWKITSAESQPVLSETELSYQIALADCVIEGEQSAVNMEAQWEADQFGLTLYLGSQVEPAGNLEISIDGGNTWQVYDQLKIFDTPSGTDGVTGATQNVDFTINGRNIQFSSKWPINYGDNISAYLKRVFKSLPDGTLPLLRDAATGSAQQNFAGWTTVAGTVDGSTRFLYGEQGMLTPGGKSLKAYQDDLHKNAASIGAVWGIMSYALKLPDPMPAGWTLSYTGSDGAEQTVAPGQATASIKVQKGSTVTLTTNSLKPENFSLWGFSEKSGAKILPTEQTYTAGDPYLTYQFTMPAADVTATYGVDAWVNIAKSPILFEENVLHNGQERSGFWYADTIDGMTRLFQSDTIILPGTDSNGNPLTTKAYFYQWDFANRFRVTSEGVPTQNQLTLVNELTNGVWLKDVNLAMREAYVHNAKGNLIAGVDCESSQDNGGLTSENVKEKLKNVDLANYANIVIDISKHSSYTTTLHFQGQSNTVGAIMQNKLQIDNKSPLKLEGDGKNSSAVKLGAAFGYFQHIISNITVTEYTKSDDFNYLLYCAHQSGFQVTDAVIQAPNKNVHAGWLTKAEEEVFFRNSMVELHSICVFKGVKVFGSYLRVRENARFGHIPIYLAENSKAVIDGNLEVNYHHWADSGYLTDKSNNWLIVKGTFCDISNRTWQSGTLICNNLVLGRIGGILGGTVITNQITNQAVGFWKYDKNNHSYTYDPYSSNQAGDANQNNDNYPFLVYHHKAAEPNTYTFSGGKIYLLGYYRAADKKYDSTVKATEGGNPVAQFMNPLIDENGDLIGSPSVDTAAAEAAVRSSTLTSNECVVLGNSAYCADPGRRSVAISGNVEIYAAGNITFYNDTTVQGGSITCNGSFGSKGDLTVTGGSITATAVGNAYNLTTTLEDGTLRWKRTDIQGGTVDTDRIGAFEKRVSGTEMPAEANQPKGTVTIGTEAHIEGTPKICHDVYINYIFDATQFTNNGNKNSLRFTTTWDGSKTFAEQSWSNPALTFTAPGMVGGGDGSWNWDSLNGVPVNGISNAGNAQNAGTDLSGEKSACDRVQMKLYAVKLNYELTFKAGASQVTAITSDGAEQTLPQTDGDKVSAAAGKKVVLTFADAAMAKDKTVLWYIDGSGIIHSVMPDRTVEGQISFDMPNSDVEVYVTEEMALDLDKASYTLLQDGFRTEANAEPKREDSKFHYLGKLVIHQGSITEDITFNIDDFRTEQMQSLGSEKQTYNKILVDKAFDNSTNGRTVTLTRIYQNGTPNSHGIDLEDGAKASFLLDGAIRICRVYVPEHADFTLKGKNNNRSKDALFPIVNGQAANNDDWAAIGNFRGKAGNITLKDLTILGREFGLLGSLGYSGYRSDNTVQYINCVYRTALDGENNRGWHDRGFLACNVKNVIFDGCDFRLRVSRDWPGFFCDNSQNLIIRNGSNITVSHNGAYDNNPASAFYAKIKNSFVIEDSTLNLSLRVPDGEDSEKDGRTYRVHLHANLIPPIELKGNATLVLEQHARLNKLVIGGTSTVKVGQEGTGYLLCQDIQVNDSATLEAGGIIVSGFYDAKQSPAELETESDFQSAMAAGKYIFDGKDSPGLVVSGGAVTAKEYITGDVNGKLAVSGGTVTAPVIGATGRYYGYTRYVPRKGEAYIYTYDYTRKTLPQGMTIRISGGQVAVTDYLGGMKSNVTVSGGAVNLGENAILGLTEAQQTTLYNYATANHLKPADFGSLTVTGGRVEGTVNSGGTGGGSISVPYGTVNVSGAGTGISVYNMMAYCGTVSVTGVTGEFYDNPYTGSDMVSGQEKLGLYVANLLSAKNLTITGGSVVYAKSAYANVPKGETGYITVTVAGDNRAYLYTIDAHGVIGEGNGKPEYNDGTSAGAGDKNVFGTKVVDVRYIIQPGNVFLDDDMGKERNPNQTALPYYTVVSSDAEDAVRYYTLQDASCSGYNFLGWYEYDPVKKELTNNRVTRIDKSNIQNVHLGAKWEKVEVEFEIRIWVEDSEYDESTMELIETGTDGKNLYRFRQTAAIPYGDPILTERGILLSHYTTKTKGVQSITYNGQTINKEVEGQYIRNTRVSADMADTYLRNKEPLILMVPEGSLSVLNALITLDQNKSDKGRPEETKFNLSEGAVQSGSNTTNQVSQYGSITATLGDIPAFAKDGQLIQPTAPGYTFGGWYTSKNVWTEATKVTAGTRLQSLYDAKTTTLYAKWTPNTYIVRFSTEEFAGESIADQRWVTSDKHAPAVGALENKSMDYHWTYDTAPETGSSFWVKKDDQKEYQTDLPSAWREGYYFEGWQLSDSKTVLSNSELSQELTKKLEVDNYVGSPAGGTPALTLYARYRPVQVTYNLNGGQWKGGTAPTANPAYGQALAGCSKETPQGLTENTDYTKLGIATGADETTEYFVLSTTSGYFASAEHQNQYVPGDYRKALSRKGYTFQGWKKAGDDTNFYGCTPRFEDIELTAQWTPNVYTLKLHVKDTAFGSYESQFSNPTPADVDIPGVTVGSPIPSAAEWPEKTKWYAYNLGAGEDTERHRLLLGVTFAGLDPGNSGDTNSGSVYLRYAEAVTNMFNSKTLFDKGNPFFLPADEDYEKDLAQAVKTGGGMSSVPDYPTGTTIPMYGVYRERSLVFIETYVDSDGVTQSRVMSSSPWKVYSDYPTQYQNKAYGKYTDLTGNGYALVDWFVGEPTIVESRRYTNNNFNSYIDTWKTAAGNKGEYDINVYTVYVAQQTITQPLTATANPTESTSPAVYTLPGSMQEGALSYQITTEDLKGLKLVSVQEMKDHQFDSTWTDDSGVTHSANETVAIELKLEKTGVVPITKDLMSGDAQKVREQYIGKDWGITLTLYHSKVMTEAKTYGPFTVLYTFEKTDSDTLKDQWLKANVTVALTPSLYAVTYRAKLPEAADKLTVLKENGFAEADSADTWSSTVQKVRYGSALLAKDKTLTLEGYDRAESWSYAHGTDQTAQLTELTLDGLTKDERKTELSDGKLTVSAGYAAKEYQLEKDTKVSWSITYGDGAGDTDAPATLNGSPANVKYHSVVTFTPDAGKPQNAAFITLTYTDSTGEKTVRLDQYEYAEVKDGSYVFPMPASGMTVGYSDVMDLYLDNGTIELSPEGFKQEGKNNGQMVPWPGNYRILQCEGDNSDFHSTPNVLKLSGDLSGRGIELGNLNITSPNSIELKDSCTVSLTQTGKLQAKNMLAPLGTNLTVTGVQSKTITLEPDDKHAAIGGSTADGENWKNGIIRLTNVDVAMMLNAPSVASGIGPGRQDSTGPSGTVTAVNSRITVTEKASASGQYTGAWIGGAGVTGVTLEGTTLLDGGGSNHDAKAVDGATVSLTSCLIGGEAKPVKEPIYAANALTVSKCQIYQKNDYALGTDSMIGTNGGTTNITESTVQIAYGGNGETNQLFTGQMLIQDAKSDITINGTQILEVSHGDIVIQESGVTQEGQTHSHSGLSYLLLEEEAMSTPAPNLRVEGLGANKTITVHKPLTEGNTVTVGNLDVRSDAKVILDGNLKVTGTATVANGQTLTAEGKASYGVTYEKGLSGEGNYVQTGGVLTGKADAVVKGNMTLTNVTADCTGYSIGSNGGSAPAEGVEGTATTVTINGGSVTASTVGACGTQNDTFTFVKTENNPTIKGNLVQDHYRLNYVVSGINVELKDQDDNPLPTALRTETLYTDGTPGTATVLDSIPANPTGTDAGQFQCWFIWDADGTTRLGLLKEEDRLPTGLTNKALLSAATVSKGMSEPAKDGTKTLSVYAWLNLSGTAAIQSGRLFKSFTGSEKTASISTRGAWTAKLESNAAFISGRDYQVTFDQPLPAGTDLTLTVVLANGNKHYHLMLTDPKDTVKFSDFTKMGTAAGAPLSFTDGDEGKELFLLSADFGELTDSAAPTGGTVSFAVLLEDGTKTELGQEPDNPAKVSYAVTAVTHGAIEADTNTVTVTTQPSGEERRSGKTVYLVGTLSKTDGNVKVPLNASASLTASGTSINGQWISGDTVAFALGEYGSLTGNSPYTFTFDKLPEGEYSIRWILCTGEGPNVLNGACSNTVSSAMTVPVKIQPRLNVTRAADSHVLSAGSEHELSFDCETTEASFAVTVEKQGILADFTEVTSSTVSSPGTVKVTIPSDPGTYRVCFSLTEDSRNDNVYYSYIVE